MARASNAVKSLKYQRLEAIYPTGEWVVIYDDTGGGVGKLAFLAV